MLTLIVHEVVAYLRPHVTEDLFVDTTRGHKLNINLDLYIPFISCDCTFTYIWLSRGGEINNNNTIITLSLALFIY